FGVATDEGVRLNLKLSHQDIANIIGTTRETVTILLGKMKSEGLVDGRRQRVVLPNLQKLAESAGRYED
ncbi:MAG: helix-turn-helix domain-containing protein, partial [Planctomycetota bacterium]